MRHPDAVWCEEGFLQLLMELTELISEDWDNITEEQMRKRIARMVFSALRVSL